MTEFELERAITVFLIYSKWEEIPEYLAKLNLKLWSDHYKHTIQVIKDNVYKKPSGSVIDVLFLDSEEKRTVVELQEEFTPPHLINKLIEDLNKQQREREFKRIIKNSGKKSIEEVQAELSQLTEDTKPEYSPRTLAEVGKDRIEEYELEKIAPSTGYKELDKFIKGFIPGHVYVLSGNTNVGKTAMCSNFTQRISAQGKTSLYFALEPENTIVDYLASIRLRKRFASLTIEDRLYDDPHIQVFGKEKIRSVGDLVIAIRSLPRFDFIVVDHIGYFTSNTTNVTTKQSDVMKELAGLAKERKCAIMLVQHLNKAKVDKGSPENNITGSASFKQDATDVLIIVRDEEENSFGNKEAKNTGAILIRKTKSDMSQGSIPIKFIEGSAIILDNSDQQEAVAEVYDEATTDF